MKYLFLLSSIVILLGIGCSPTTPAQNVPSTLTSQATTTFQQSAAGTVPAPTTQMDAAMRAGIPFVDVGKLALSAQQLDAMNQLAPDQKGMLVNVTKGQKIRGLRFEDSATGEAASRWDGNMYQLYAEAEGLPTPQEDDFYEGWIVRKDPFAFISTGKLVKRGDIFVNGYTSDKDLSLFTLYVVTLEPDDGDPAPAAHIIEGDMEAVMLDDNSMTPEKPSLEPVQPVFCTQDAKQCPDGSYVGRSGPNCEFKPCPRVIQEETTEAKEVTINVTGKNFSFNPATITVNKGDIVTVNFTSEQGFHDFSLDQYSVRTRAVNTGEATSVTFTADKVGTYTYYCSIGSHRSLGMEGVITVVE